MNRFGDRQVVLAHARRQAIALAQMAEIATRLGGADAPERDSEAAVRAGTALGKAMIAGGKVTSEEAVVFMVFAVEGLHTKRWLAGDYPEIAAISAAMR